MRSLLLLALVATAACSDPEGKNKAKDPDPVKEDTGDPQQIPPTSCPVGDLALTKADLAADEAMLEQWNELRGNPGDCAGTAMAAAAPLSTNENLMWLARCWAFDISVKGAPSDPPNQFSDGTSLEDAAVAMGVTGFVHTWSLVGNVQTPSDAFSEWLDGGGSTCENLWADSSSGAAALSDAGGLLVAVRLTTLDAR